MTTMFDGPGVDASENGVPAAARPVSLEGSPFEALQAAMSRPLPAEFVGISPIGRPEVYVRIRTNVDFDELNQWRKGAKDEQFDGGFDPVRLACILLANASTDIVIHGRSTGMTLASPEIHQQMYPDAFDEVDAVRHFFGKQDVWLSGRVLPWISTIFAGGEDGEAALRPTAPDQLTS